MGEGPAPAAAGESRSAVAAGFTVLFVSTRVNFAFGILFKPILLDLGSDRSTLALAATASLTVNALGQPVFGALIDRLGPRRVILSSMGLMTAGTALVALAERPWQLILLSRRDLRDGQPIPPPGRRARLVRGRPRLRPDPELPGHLPRRRRHRAGLGHRHLVRPTAHCMTHPALPSRDGSRRRGRGRVCSDLVGSGPTVTRVAPCGSPTPSPS